MEQQADVQSFHRHYSKHSSHDQHHTLPDSKAEQFRGGVEVQSQGSARGLMPFITGRAKPPTDRLCFYAAKLDAACNASRHIERQAPPA